MHMAKTTPKGIAIDILSRRNNSEKEMRMKLKRKGILTKDIEETIEWLTQKKLLNDPDFAQQKAESIFRTKLCGPRYITQKLREAGIAGDVIEDVVDNLASPEDWNQRAQQAIEQWQKVHPKHKDDNIRHMRFLASRGFDSSHN